jgi:hypothetical protein
MMTTEVIILSVNSCTKNSKMKKDCRGWEGHRPAWRGREANPYDQLFNLCLNDAWSWLWREKSSLSCSKHSHSFKAMKTIAMYQSTEWIKTGRVGL